MALKLSETTRQYAMWGAFAGMATGYVIGPPGVENIYHLLPDAVTAQVANDVAVVLGDIAEIDLKNEEWKDWFIWRTLTAAAPLGGGGLAIGAVLGSVKDKIDRVCGAAKSFADRRKKNT